MKVYDKELEMYDTILPKVNDALNISGIPENIFANTVYCCYKKKAIIFEDLSLRGYRMPKRSNGLDLEHSKILLRNLAIFHASCSHIRELNPDIFKNFKHGKLKKI